MPITQQRMIAVLDAAMHVLNSFEQIRDLTRIELERMTREPEYMPTGTQTIAGIVEVVSLDPYKIAKLLNESQYFARVKAANDRAKRKQEARRLRKRGEAPAERPFNPGGTANKYLSNNPLERALQTAAPGEFEAFMRGDLAGPPEAIAPDDVISLATPEGVKQTISLDKKTGETIERKVTFTEEADASGTPLSGLSPDALESGESIL